MSIIIVSGTNRKQSNTRKVAQILFDKVLAKEAQSQLIDLNELPLEVFKPDAYFNPPEGFAPFQEKISKAKGIIWVTPEYNGSFPGVLKYFIDHLKFPESLVNVPSCFVGLSAGVFGAARSIEQLQHILLYRNSIIHPGKLLLPKINDLLSADKSSLVSEYHAQKMDQLIEDFSNFIHQK